VVEAADYSKEQEQEEKKEEKACRHLLHYRYHCM